MAETRSKAIEAWGLGELIQVLRQIAREAAVPEGVLPPVDQQQRFARELRAAEQGGSRA
jgi:hypothetical protein